MGRGSYDHGARSHVTASYAAMSDHEVSEQVFTARKLDPEMDPKDLTFRESRDSEEHPNSLPIIIGLDVTGSMGSLPRHIVRDGLPNIIKKLQDAGVADPQILFLGIGDHVFDEAPIQVGQFESSDELLDKWLTKVYLEGHGGNNTGESYVLAWLVGGKHTEIDSLEKRGQKGFLFTIGDEPMLPRVDMDSLNRMFGKQYQGSLEIEEIHAMASEKYEVVHFHTTETSAGSRLQDVPEFNRAKALLGQNLVKIQSVNELAERIAHIVSARIDEEAIAVPAEPETDSTEEVPEKETPEML